MAENSGSSSGYRTVVRCKNSTKRCEDLLGSLWFGWTRCAAAHAKSSKGRAAAVERFRER